MMRKRADCQMWAAAWTALTPGSVRPRPARYAPALTELLALGDIITYMAECEHEHVRQDYDGGFQDDITCLNCGKKFSDRSDLYEERDAAKQRNAQQPPSPPTK